MNYTIYIATSNSLIPSFRKMESFELELGLSLTSPENNRRSKEQYHSFLPNDENIQAHFLYRNEIINKLGNLGALNIYTGNSLNMGEIMICNLDQHKLYQINTENDLYKELNKCMGDFLKSFGYIKDEPIKDEPIKDEPIKDEPIKDEIIKDEPIKDEIVEEIQEVKEDVVLNESNDVSIDKVQVILQNKNNSVRMYENENADNDLDIHIHKPVIDQSDLEKARNSISDKKIEEIKKKPQMMWSDEERILIARSRK